MAAEGVWQRKGGCSRDHCEGKSEIKGKEKKEKRKRGGRRAEFSLRGPVEERRSVSEEKRKGEKIAS